MHLLAVDFFYRCTAGLAVVFIVCGDLSFWLCAGLLLWVEWDDMIQSISISRTVGRLLSHAICISK